MLKIRPLEDRVVVRPFDPEEKTAGGIFLPDTAKEKPTRGEVIAVGGGRFLKTGERAKPAVKEGDTVLFGRYAGTEFKHNGTEYRIISEGEILAIVETAK
jgi:chaperonin GroES